MKLVRNIYKKAQPTQPDPQLIEEYFAKKRASIILDPRSTVLIDFKKVYDEQLTVLAQCQLNKGGFVAGVKNLFTKTAKESDPTEAIRGEANTNYASLQKVTNKDHRIKLQNSIAELEKALGYAPGINWNAIGAKAIGIGVLTLVFTKFAPGPLKVVTLLMSISAFATGVLAFAYNYCKSNDNDHMPSVMFIRKVGQYAEVARMGEQVDRVIALIRSKSKPTMRNVKLNLERWVQCYKDNYQNEVNQVPEIVR